MSMQQYPFSPRTEFTEEELSAFLERERFLKERERALQRAMIEGRPIESVDAPQPVQEQPAPSTPVEQPAAQPDSPSMLGLTLPVTDQDILLEAYRVAEQQAQENLESTLDKELLEKRQQATVDRMLNRSVTPEGTDIGTFGLSDLLLNTDGYVRGEDGQPRKASGAEILLQGFGRQVLFRGAEAEKRLSEINATRERKLADLKAQGMSDLEARENVDAWYNGQLTEVNKQNRTIAETGLASILRQMGLGSSAAEEIVFDTMPLFYEVDDQGNPTNLDSWSDAYAYMVDSARRAGAEAVGLEAADLEALGRKGAAAFLRASPGMSAYANLVGGVAQTQGLGLEDVVPVPFSPIDRVAQTTSAERGRRAAANTGGFMGDVGMAWARGRSFHDGFTAIPSYRNQLGDAQWLSLFPAMGIEAVLPGGPLDVTSKVAKGARALAKSGVLGKTLSRAANVGGISDWEQAHRVVAEVGEMMDDAGRLNVAEVAATRGEPARVVAANTSRELSTPYKLQALARDEATTIGELEGAAQTSEVGRHIMARVYETGAISEIAPAEDALTAAQRAAVDMAVMEWRLGVESSVVARELVGDGKALRTSAEQLDNVILNTTGRRGFNTLQASDLYAPVRDLAKRGAPPQDVADAFRKAAREAGSPGIRSNHRAMRMLLSLGDETAAMGASNAFDVVHPLAANMGNAKSFPFPTPGLRYGAGLERAFRHTLNEVVDAHLPRDVRFVTDRLMVPVDRITPSLQRQVGAMERALYKPTYDDGIYKLQDNADADAILNRVFSVLPSAVGKRPEMVDPIRDALYAGALDLKQHAFVSDALREAAWRELVGEVATTPTMATRQTARAVARQSFTTDVLDKVVDTVSGMVRLAATGPTRAVGAVFEAMPDSKIAQQMLRNVQRYNEAWDQRLVSRWLLSSNPARPQALQRTTELINNDVGLVQRAYRRELRATVAAARQRGAAKPGVAALNQMAGVRWRRLAETALSRFRREVDRLAQASRENAAVEPSRRLPTDVEFVALALYRNGHAQVNIGRTLEELRLMDEGTQRKFVQIAETLVTQGTYMQQWRNLMRDFFTRSASRKNPATADLLKKIDAELQAAVRVDEAGADAVRARAAVNPEKDLAPSMVLKLLADVADAAMLEPSPTNIQTVVNRLRDKVDLKFRGAAVFTPTGYRDASLEAGQVWQMSVDEQLAVAARVDDLVRTNPELLVQLTPLINEMTTASVAARQLEYQAPVATMKAVLSGLRDMAEASGVVINKKLYNEALLEVSNVVKAPAEAVGAMPSPKVKVAEDLSVKFAKRGVIHKVSNWTRGRLKTMSNRERLSMAETSLREMLTRKTLYPGGRGVRLITVGGTAGKKDAAFGYFSNILTAARYSGAGAQPDKASKFAVRTVRQMLNSGVDESLITRRMVDDAMTAVDNIVADYIENQVRNTMRRYGFDSFSAPGSLERLTQTVIATPVDDAYAYAILPGMEDVFEKLHSYAATGRLLPLLNTLQGRTMLKERAAGDFLMSLLGDFVEGTRQTTAYGLLSAGLVVGGPAGVYPMMIPIARYIGLNLLTATGMMVGTLGSSRATRALGYAAADVARKIDETARGAARKAAQRVGLVNTVTPVPPNTVIFRDVYGKEWTRAEFDELCEMWNSYMSRAEVDQTFNVLRTMQRELGVIAKGDASLANAPWYRQASRYVNPFYEAPGMQFAVWTDTVFRRGAFASAIRDGYTPAQAAEIAKASVLDYGAVPDLLKQKFNKYLLFATFRAASTGAILQSLFAGRTEWLRVLRLQMQMHKAAETWTFGADHDKVRSFTIPGPQFDYRPTAVAGPQEVFASGAADYISALYFAGAFVVATATGDDSVGGDLKGRALTAVAEENIQPFFQLLLTLFANQRPSSRGRLVPDTWVAAMQNSNSWEWAVDRYQIEDINPTFNLEEMRPGAPTFEGSQYVFMGNGYRQFMIDQYLAMVLMSKRSTEDTYRALVGSPYPPGEGYDPKYRAIVPFYLYLPGVATPIRLRSPEDIYQRALRQDIFR